MRYGRWEDALVTQMRLLQWYGTRPGRDYLGEFFRRMNVKHKPEAQVDPRLLAGIQVQTLREAEPVYVSADVTELIDHARRTFEPEPVRPSDPFVPSGFALFPRPLVVDDGPCTEQSPLRSIIGLIPIRAVAWMSVLYDEETPTGTFWISYYADWDDEVQLGDLEKRWVLDEAIRRSEPTLTLVHQWQWSWGADPKRDWLDPDRLDILPEDGVEETLRRARQQVQLAQTIWRLGSQLVPAKERPIRQMRREALRKGMEHEDVTVIRLRREHEHEFNGDRNGTTPMQHVVRGYWRWQNYRDGERRQIWIKPFLRGDPTKGFKQTTRAWEFTR